MALVRLFLDGRSQSAGSPLLTHNERLADPLDAFSLEIGKVSKKRGKTEADHLEIARLEFLGGLYTQPVIASPADVNGQDPQFPIWNIVRAIQDAGKQHKLGRTVLRAIVPATVMTPIQYDGPRGLEEMLQAGTFALRKSVGIGTSRTMRTRPVFAEWQIEGDVNVDLTQIDVAKVDQLIYEAGKFQGVGDNRPVYGRFHGRAVLVSDLEKKGGKE